WYNNKKIGKLNISNLKAITKKVVLVPVNNTNVSVTSTQLNEIFKQANVTWSLSTAPNFTFNLGQDGLEAADANLMNKYSTEMRSLRNAYRDFDTLYDKEACYLFMVSNFTDPNVKGYMVRNRAVGFIKAGITNKETAHELSHGAFGLEHTFPKIAKNTSNNLMDYSNGNNLILQQWTQIQSPNSSFSWLDNSEDGSYLGPENTAVSVFNWINKIKVAYKNNATLTIPKNTNLIGRAAACYLGCVQYDSICVYVQDKTTDQTATVVNNVVIGTAQKVVYSTTITYQCIIIDGGKIIIEVPTARLSNMLYYIKNTQTFKNLILFVNGYRPIVNGDGDGDIRNLITLEYPASINQIEYGDSRGYWQGIDAKFMERIGTRTSVYADGHHSVATSNHFTAVKFNDGYLKSIILKKSCGLFPNSTLCLNCGSEFLHTNPAHPAGFNIRKTSGENAAQDLLQRINDGSIIFNKLTDTLDIVAHSMGYAYAVGMVNVLINANIHLGRFYILAPENACSGGNDWSKFKEVWQYGSNLGQPNQAPLWDQDGVAPQCPVQGINTLPQTTKGGRAFIPDDYEKKGYLESHTVKNYDWIFTKQLFGMPGYVKKRN
ncbi:MAG: hypothetical protein ABIP51_21795, partial [Bacteroidia bacterium]